VPTDWGPNMCRRLGEIKKPSTSALALCFGRVEWIQRHLSLQGGAKKKKSDPLSGERKRHPSLHVWLMASWTQWYQRSRLPRERGGEV